MIKDYRLSSVSFPKAKAGPQPCFNSEQVNQLIEIGKDEEKLAFALMGFAGLRIGEIEQLYWEDIKVQSNKYSMIHIRRGGSNGTPKDKDDRFVPIHPTVEELLGRVRKRPGTVFKNVTERRLLKRLKELCVQCKFDNPRQ